MIQAIVDGNSKSEIILGKKVVNGKFIVLKLVAVHEKRAEHSLHNHGTVSDPLKRS